MRVTEFKFLAIFSGLLIAWAVVFFDALVAMEAIWRRSDTFAHGYFIFPISAWLLWRDRQTLINSQLSSSWFALPFLLGALVVWLFAYAADINVLGQLAAVIAIIALIWLLIGDRLAWHYKFPLAFLLFAVPMGENLIPWLQDVTAWFTVAFLKLHGIPVFRDGLYIQVPSGLFEVAVACSGIRYLIASVAVGTLYAYLTYSKGYKQFAFIIFAAVLPILANGLRAYGIVIIAHYSDMKYATGADHLVYGWLFFGVVIMLMFWVGGLFADQESKQTNDVAISLRKTSLFPSALALIALVSSSLLIQSIQTVSKPVHPAAALQGEEVKGSHWGITFNDALQRSHIRLDQNTEAVRAVYAHKQDKGELVSWHNRIFDDKKWTIVGESTLSLVDRNIKILHLRNTLGVEKSIAYWYQVSDKFFISSTKAKLYQAIMVFLQPNSTAEVVALTSNKLDEKNITKKVQLYLSQSAKLSLQMGN